VGQPADLAILKRAASDPFASLAASTRRDVRLTMVGGVPCVGDYAMKAVFAASRQPHADARVDGEPRYIARWIARRARRMAICEPGLEVSI
jgi:hypothetical protein